MLMRSSPGTTLGLIRVGYGRIELGGCILTGMRQADKIQRHGSGESFSRRRSGACGAQIVTRELVGQNLASDPSHVAIR